MRALIGSVTHYLNRVDPTPSVLLAATWSLINGISFLLSGSLEHRKSMELVMALRLTPDQLAMVCFIDSSLLVMSVLPQVHLWAKSSIAVISSLMWSVYGGLVCVAAYHYGIISTTGTWSIVCAISLKVATAQWVFQNERH
jgi:hypothetical protein